jgi:hypothetical protein
MRFWVRRQIGEEVATVGERNTFAEAQELLFRYVAEGGEFEYLDIVEPADEKHFATWLFHPEDPAHQAAVERARSHASTGREPHSALPSDDSSDH